MSDHRGETRDEVLSRDTGGRDPRREVRMGKWRRLTQRYFVPSIVKSLYYYLSNGAAVSPSADVQLSGYIQLGKGTVVKPFATIQTSGGRITTGIECAIGRYNLVSAGGENGNIVMGDYVRMGPHVTVMATTREYRRSDRLIVEQGYRDKGISIGNDVLIGTGAILVDGCEIGDGAVIGVNSVVSGKVAPNAVVFGSPAKPIFWRR